MSVGGMSWLYRKSPDTSEQLNLVIQTEFICCFRRYFFEKSLQTS